MSCGDDERLRIPQSAARSSLPSSWDLPSPGTTPKIGTGTTSKIGTERLLKASWPIQRLRREHACTHYKGTDRQYRRDTALAADEGTGVRHQHLARLLPPVGRSGRARPERRTGIRASDREETVRAAGHETHRHRAAPLARRRSNPQEKGSQEARKLKAGLHAIHCGPARRV